MLPHGVRVALGTAGRLGAMSRSTTGVLGALGWVAVGSMVANACAYGVHLASSRMWPSPAEYGEFAVLLAAMLVLGAFALAVQAVVAREVVLGRAAALPRLAIKAGAAVALLAVIGAPVMAVIADTSIGAAFAGLAAAPFLLLVGAGQGIIQGRGEFQLLAWLLAVVGILRSVPVVAAIMLGAGPTGALAVGTAGTAVSAGCVWIAVIRRSTPARDAAPTAANLLTVARASQVQLVLIVASSVDLLLARTVLDERSAGIFALGAIATKVAFWLPQAVGVVFYPRLADPATSGRSFRHAVLVVAGLGAAVTAAAALAGPLVPLVIGEDYRPLVPILGLFAYTGSALAVLQVALLSAIARDRTVVATIAWAVVTCEVILVLVLVSTVLALAVVAAVAATVSAAITTAYCLHVARSPRDQDQLPDNVR